MPTWCNLHGSVLCRHPTISHHDRMAITNTTPSKPANRVSSVLEAKKQQHKKKRQHQKSLYRSRAQLRVTPPPNNTHPMVTREKARAPSRGVILQTYELLHAIIIMLSPEEILAARRVCREWNDLIMTSHAMRVRLFLNSEHRQPVISGPGPSDLSHPLSRPHLTTAAESSGGVPWPTVVPGRGQVLANEHFFKLGGAWAWTLQNVRFWQPRLQFHGRPDWRRLAMDVSNGGSLVGEMFVSMPPVQRVLWTFEVKKWVDEGQGLPPKLVKHWTRLEIQRPEGVRIRDMARAAMISMGSSAWSPGGAMIVHDRRRTNQSMVWLLEGRCFNEQERQRYEATKAPSQAQDAAMQP